MSLNPSLSGAEANKAEDSNTLDNNAILNNTLLKPGASIATQFDSDNFACFNNYDEGVQIEICATSEDESDYDETAIILKNIQEKSNPISDSASERKLNESLWHILNDHNYTAQKLISNKIDECGSSDNNALKKLLIDHIYTNNSFHTPSNEIKRESNCSSMVSALIDKIMDTMSSYSIQEELNKKRLDMNESQNEEIFVQNVMNVVGAEEDEEKAEEKITQKLNRSMEIFPHLSDSENEFGNFESTNSQTLKEQNQSKVDSMENNINDVFEFECTPNDSSNQLLNDLLNFSKSLHNDCMAFQSASTNINAKLKTYVQEKFNKFKQIICNELQHVHKEQQTDVCRISARQKRLINKKTKKDLLKESSESEIYSSSDESQSSDNLTRVNSNFLPNKVPVMSHDLETSRGRQTNQTAFFGGPSDKEECPKFSALNEYDDGISMSQYIQSVIFASSSQSDEESLYSDKEVSSKVSEKIQKVVSETENSNDENGIFGIKKGSAIFKNKKHSCSESDKENKLQIRKNALQSESSDEDSRVDKEIQRLLNINSLGKRPSYTNSKLTKYSDKQTVKATVVKNKKKSLEFLEDEIGKSAESDEGISEKEDEIITEEQYLARRNELLKKELLNTSSSDSELSDQEVDIEENGSNSPLIDKFLENFVVDESETEENSDNEFSKSDVFIDHQAEDTPLNSKELNKKNLKSSPTTSDTDILSNEQNYNAKQQSSKNLEKMISEVEKRKKSNKLEDDLISLSSESAGTDIESVENCPVDQKSRIIKPMLRQDQLRSETRKAQKEEAERIRRLERKQTKMTEVLKENAESVKDDFILDYIEDTKQFVKVHSGIVKQLKKHQFDGVKFMYDSCYGSADALKKNNGSGCILAHCMGLGKTLQLIALLHTVISYRELKTSKVLVLCPKSTVMNWADEVRRWLAPLNTRNLRVYTFNDTSDINEKLSVIKKWSQSSFGNAGALLIGYEAFRTLVFYHSYKNRGNNSTARLEEIREKIDSYLLNPGADLVVCDEGHIIKNSKSAISMAVSKITTQRRIVLTGTPIQNNLKEYYSMVNFIKPLFLGTEKEFANLYANPIKNGQHKDSSKLDIKIMKQRSFVLHKKLSKFVQRKEAELLKTFLPQKFEYVLFIPMTNVQNNLYEYILEAISRRQENRGRTLITDYTCLRKIWTHPKVLEDAWKNAIDSKNKKDIPKQKTPHSDDDQPDDIYDSQTGVMSVTNDWWRSLLDTKQLESIFPSNKLRATFEILRMCEEKGEKCLIFSAFVAVLNVVEYFFKKLTNCEESILNELGTLKSSKTSNQWIAGKDYYRLDGKTPKSLRHEMIKQFNMPDNKRARVFLISSKAGGQGINLTGANRVIILDTSWNPSNDQQNIFRVFRLGQKRKCYIYRLLAMGTMEEKVYSRSVTKQAMSYRVVDEQQIDRHYSLAELAELYTLTKPDFSQRPVPILPQDSILASLMLSYPEMVYKYHEHDSLLENKIEQELSEQEKADAWIAYERDIQNSAQVQDIPNMENTAQANFTIPKIPNYLGQIPGLDMQTLLNYSMNNISKSTSPYIKSLMAQYSYPQNQQQQQYLDMFNLYQNYVMNFPNDTFNMASNMYPQINAGNHLATNSPAFLSSLHGNSGMNTNPLAALDDLSMYGIGPPKNLMSSANSSALPSMNSPLSNFGGTPSGGNLVNPVSNSPLPLFGKYKPNSFDHNFVSNFNFKNKDLPGNNFNASSNITASSKDSPSTSNFFVRDQFNMPKNSYPKNQSKSSKSNTSQIVELHDNTEASKHANSAKVPSITMPPTFQTHEVYSKKQTANMQDQINITSAILNSSQNEQRSLKKTAASKPSHMQASSNSLAKEHSDQKTPTSIENQVSSNSGLKSHLNESVKSKHPVTRADRNERGNLSAAVSGKSIENTSITNAAPHHSISKSSKKEEKSKNVALANKKEKSESNSINTTHYKHYEEQPALLEKSQSGTLNPLTSTDGVNTRIGGVNIGISYPTSFNLIENSAKSVKSVNKEKNPNNSISSPVVQNILKNNGEMQIILTTTGSTTISKQLSDISPSISLTAVHQAKPSQTTPAIPLSLSSYKITSQPQNPATNQPQEIHHKSNTVAKVTDIVIDKTQLQFQKKTSTLSTNESMRKLISKRTHTEENLIEANSSITSTSTSRTTPVMLMSPKKASRSQLNSTQPAVTQKTLPIPVAISKNVIKTPTLHGQPQSQKAPIITNVSSQISVRTNKPISPDGSKNNISRNLESFETIKSKVNFRSAAVHDSSKIGQTDQQKKFFRAGSLPSRSSPIQKNAINIRPANDGNNLLANKGAYVIETSINDRRVAIGTPTKSGGGTTVTKIAKKRPSPENNYIHSQEISDIKRVRHNNL